MILTKRNEILKRWTEHFKELLNKENNDLQCIINNNDYRNVDHDDIDEPTEEEIRDVITGLKKNKAPGMDCIQSELLQSSIKELTQDILIKDIWTQEMIPDDWKVEVICPLHKKGDQMICSNYRGITLLNTTYKIFSRILHNRLLPYTERAIGNYQAGFRSGKSTIDQIFILRQIIEKTYEQNIETHHLFVDFSTVYDSINRAELYNAMVELNIPKKHVWMTISVK
ncbi:hypothetical protein ANN_14431 [Periplaneta americana]|uniref:Reverse transcriptase domain-containing protein n=1 Tax=Periplaneta americana TaxID=6978 RepID=A0ABQ8SXI2_PERAM|nr:hypothetical protein ANN_14431 [Periplaneta americana]